MNIKAFQIQFFIVCLIQYFICNLLFNLNFLSNFGLAIVKNNPSLKSLINSLSLKVNEGLNSLEVDKRLLDPED